MPGETGAEDQFRGKGAEHHMVRGSAWMIAMRWAIRLIGIVSSVILARLLAPDDFGLIAIAMLSAAFIDTLLKSGMAQAIIRHPNPERAHYDTAWTLQVITGGLVTALIFVLAPLAGEFFDEPRATLVIRILGLRALLVGFDNIGVADFLRDLNYSRDFTYNVVPKIVTAIATVVLALIMRTYWALIIGAFVMEFLRLGMSYWMSPYRPRFGLGKSREILGFSVWMVGNNYGTLFLQRLDELVVARLFSTPQMGFYTIANELGTVTTTEIIFPLTRSLYPIYSKLANAREELAWRYLQAYSVIVAIALSTSAGIALIADDLVAVVLGEKWLPIAPIIPWLALAGAMQMLATSSNIVLPAIGKPRLATLLQWVSLGFLVLALPYGGELYGLEGVAGARALVMILMVPAGMAVIRQELPVGFSDYARCFWRPVIATLAMAVMLLYVIPGDWTANVPLRLIVDILAGAATYGAVTSVLWRWAGKPGGIETLVFSGLARVKNRGA